MNGRVGKMERERERERGRESEGESRVERERASGEWRHLLEPVSPCVSLVLRLSVLRCVVLR